MVRFLNVGKSRFRGASMKKYRTFICLITAGFIAIILAGSVSIHMQVRNYKEKIQILSVMAEGQGEDSLAAAIALLKGAEGPAGERGEKLLESYGYLKPKANWYSLGLRRDILQISLLSLLAFALYVLALLCLYRMSARKRRQELQELGSILEQFQNNDYTLKGGRSCPGGGEMGQVWSQLELLGERMAVGQRRLEAEKEGTKSLVTDISHQLKTPVAGLKACFEILAQEDLSPKEQEEFREQCRRQLEGLEAMAGALVNISRMETGMIQIKKEPADILETLISAINRVYLKAEEKQISIELEEGEEPPGFLIPHDVKWVCEAFINLLENAIKYSGSQTVISIRMAAYIHFLRIEISDQGIGIPKEEYHKIFKRFYRGAGTEVGQAEGSGVGLYLTREIIGNHGGTVTVNSRCHGNRRGSTFVVQLPLS